MIRTKFTTVDTIITPIYARSIDEFNSYVTKYKTENKIILTKGKNISQESLRHMPCSLVWKRGNHYEFQYLDSEIQIRVLYNIRCENEDFDSSISYKALYYFNGMLDVIPKDDIEEDIEMFTCPENPDSKYYNYVNPRYIGFTIENTYSLDMNSAFLASMVEVYPQTKLWVDKYYNDKLAGITEIKQYDKIIIGWLNNPRMHRSHAWKKIIDNVNKKIHKMRNIISNNGNIILLVNTDAIKFIGNYTYKESRDLGKFKYEWKNTKMYIKGIKSYAYLNEDKWKFKQAGYCKLDELKPRSEWTLEEFKSFDTIKVKRVRLMKNGLLGEVYE